MRRLVILAFLIGGMELIAPLGDAGRGSEWLLTFGFLILAAYSVAEIASGLGLPKIVGYLLAGVVFGPGGIEVVSRQASASLAPVSSLAIALIAYLAGAELRWAELRHRWPAILRIMTAELGIAFVLLAGAMTLVLGRVPAFANAAPAEIVAFSVLFASVAIVHSPAVTLALLTETGARGRVAQTTLGVVLLADVAVVLLFSAVLAVTRAVVPSSAADPAQGPLRLVWELGGGALVGAVLGGAVALYLRFLRQELFFFAIMVALVGEALARVLHVETLLLLLVAGFVSENVSRPEHGAALRHAMERSAAPVFVVFFAVAGTKIIPLEVGGILLLAGPIVLVRMLGIWLGTRAGAAWAGEPPESRLVWKGLVSQAGVALGLATLLGQAYPGRGGELQAIFVAVIAINELVGPILFRQALDQSGEVPSAPPPEAAPTLETEIPGTLPDLRRPRA